MDEGLLDVAASEWLPGRRVGDAERCSDEELEVVSLRAGVVEGRAATMRDVAVTFREAATSVVICSMGVPAAESDAAAPVLGGGGP